jgi:hypothetical protein
MGKKRKKSGSRGAEVGDDGAAASVEGVDGPAAPPTSKRRVLAHRCTSVGWMPSGVTSLSARAPAADAEAEPGAAASSSSGGGYLAVGRENGNVEVWALDGQYC